MKRIAIFLLCVLAVLLLVDYFGGWPSSKQSEEVVVQRPERTLKADPIPATHPRPEAVTPNAAPTQTRKSAPKASSEAPKASQTQSGPLEIPVSNLGAEQIIAHVGFTLGYNSRTRLPNWVAYELTRAEVSGEEPRGSHFRPDPQARGVQAANDDYRNSGWDKGHMCPAGDMKWSKQAMNESFYFTNICPQNRNLNRGDWKDLEELCRDLASRYGNLYIVCGPVVGQAKNGRLGANAVTIPDGFYKALLAKTPNGYTAIGFYFENAAGSRNLNYYARTIDQIEAMTHIDLFPALPDAIEQSIESNFTLSHWGIN